MIPKKIHYIWLGKNPLPKNILSCIQSWHTFLPEYTIIKWDESNIPQNINFVNSMIETEQWAFASDCLRFWILQNCGGIYLDTDMKILKNIDNFLQCNFFIGKESNEFISGGIIGSIANHTIVCECLNYYLEITDETSLVEFNKRRVLIPQLLTEVIYRNGSSSTENNEIELNDGIAIYPSKYFYPVSFTNRSNIHNFTESKDNYAIHLWDASWHNEFENIVHANYTKSLQILLKKIRKGKGIGSTYLFKYIRFFLIHFFKKTFNL